MARAFRTRRESLGRTQADVARRMGTSQKAVSRLEAGLVDARASTLERWAGALDCRLAIVLEDASSSPELVGYEDLPGYDLLVRGLADLRAERPTREAFAVAVVAPRLRSDGLTVPDSLPAEPKDRLWDLLERDVGDDAHARYNALIARLLSFVAGYEALHHGERGANAAAG